MAVNYEDERFAQVETDKNAAMSDLQNTYDGMINESDKYYQAQVDASKQWADKQSQIQQENTDFAIEKIQQQKDQANKDYLKEQSGAYVDWQKQSNQYGANAEQMAAGGFTGTGFSESSQVGMYNTYQNRVSAARDAYSRAVLNYDNAMKDARLQNNSVLAEIAYQALQTELELSLQGFQYKNNLILEQANKKIELDNMYHNRYMDVLNQINTENAMTEQIRQFNQNYQLQVKQYEEGIRQFNAEIERLKKKDDEESRYKAQQLEMQKAEMEEQKRQFEESQKIKQQQLEEEKRQYDTTFQAKYGRLPGEEAPASSGGGGGGGGTKKAATNPTIDKNANSSGSGASSNYIGLGLGPLSDNGFNQALANGQVVISGDYAYRVENPDPILSKYSPLSTQQIFGTTANTVKKTSQHSVRSGKF